MNQMHTASLKSYNNQIEYLAAYLPSSQVLSLKTYTLTSYNASRFLEVKVHSFTKTLTTDQGLRDIKQDVDRLSQGGVTSFGEMEKNQSF